LSRKSSRSSNVCYFPETARLKTALPSLQNKVVAVPIQSSGRLAGFGVGFSTSRSVLVGDEINPVSTYTSVLA
jgi:hypothetical protein